MIHTFRLDTCIIALPKQRLLQALCKFHTLPGQLLDHILHPIPSPATPVRSLPACGLPAQLSVALGQQYNTSQEAAIAATAHHRHNCQFTLVQVRPRLWLIERSKKAIYYSLLP